MVLLVWYNVTTDRGEVKTMARKEMTDYEKRKVREIKSTLNELGFTIMPYVQDEQILDNVRTAASIRRAYEANLGEEPDLTVPSSERTYEGGFQLAYIFRQLQAIGIEPPNELLRAIEMRVESRYSQHPDREAIDRHFNFQPATEELSDGITMDGEGNVYLNGLLITEHTRETLILQIQMIVNTPAFIGQNQKHYDALERYIVRIERLTLRQVAYLYRVRGQIQITGDFYDSDGSQTYVKGVESIEQFIIEAERF